MPTEQLIDLFRSDIHTAANDQILAATDKAIETPIARDLEKIAGTEEPVWGECRLGLLGRVVVAFEHGRPANLQLSRYAHFGDLAAVTD